MFLVASEISKDIGSEIELEKNTLQVRLRKFFFAVPSIFSTFSQNKIKIFMQKILSCYGFSFPVTGKGFCFGKNPEP